MHDSTSDSLRCKANFQPFTSSCDSTQTPIGLPKNALGIPVSLLRQRIEFTQGHWKNKRTLRSNSKDTTT